MIEYLLEENRILKKQFETISDSAGIELIHTMPCVPEQNGYAERFVRSIKKECLDHFIFVGAKSLQKAVIEYVKHYNHERNHQGINNQIPVPYPEQNLGKSRLIVKSERLGGLLNYYYCEPNEQYEKKEAIAA